MTSNILACSLSLSRRTLWKSYRNGRFLTTTSSSTAVSANDYTVRREGFAREIDALVEYQASKRLENFIKAKANNQPPSDIVTSPTPPAGGYKYEMDDTQIRNSLDAAMATFCLHIESRIASMIGHGFYTIGPCGEEALSSIGCVLGPQDSAALHYRHLGVNIARQLSQGESLQNILMDRARGYTVSRQDPVTGGVHCSIGSVPSTYPGPGAGDFIVTSTLASQCPPAVGRALGYSYIDAAARRTRPVSLVTLGDGSVHNHHFWSAFHLARHARHKTTKCPVLFGISDNGLSISYKTGGYVDTIFENDPLVPLYRVNGNDLLHVYSQTMAAAAYARKQSAPAVLLYKNLIRRFGHAATDRQAAYLDMDEIASMADNDVLESIMMQAVEDCSALTYAEVWDRYQEIQKWTQESFEMASREEKVTRQDMMDRVAQPPTVWLPPTPQESPSTPAAPSSSKPEVMRKHMTRVLTEQMTQDKSIIYLGEDVRHGGYYIVTEGLANTFPTRVLDFPPDETSLLGAGMGFAQVGLTPIVEIPYAKYLDCGADMFYEIAISNWLSDAQRPNGMIIRLQGFDRGLFGGNFHTTNILPHMPPGVDVVCYSNGADYVRGFRNAIAQAKAGRIVMSVDCTNLLNLRHLHAKDRGWERAYPAPDEHGAMSFDEVGRYGTKASTCIVTYGNGVVTALQARRLLVETGAIQSEEELDIVDNPYLNDVSAGLRDAVRQYDRVLFADICKEGPGGGVLSHLVTSLRKEGSLPSVWDVVAAPRTYNPLGNVCTFLNVDDIVHAYKGLQNSSTAPCHVVNPLIA